MTIFQSAVQKLTLWYVGALFVVCLVFSLATYTVAANRLERGARDQAAIIEKFDGTPALLIPRAKLLRDQQITQDRQQLQRTLVLANIVILSLGAYAGYHFAKRTLQPLEDAHQAQTRFATDASHELRTPLATMQAEIEVALRDKNFNGTQAKQVLHSNLEEIARLHGLSEQLLGLARLDSGTLLKKRVMINKLVEHEANRLQKLYPEATLELSTTPRLSLEGDEKLLRQLVSILADNAHKYAGEKPMHLAVGLSQHEDTVQLSFTDQGVGIKATELPHIFDRFYRGSSAAKHSPSGHGLGLSLAKKITEAHGGTITATSQKGAGTTFLISLPT